MMHEEYTKANMNAYTIKTFIIKLERENQALREENAQLKATIEEMSHDDSESVTSTETIVPKNLNEGLVDHFRARALSEQDVHKSRAFRKAADVIDDLTFKLSCGEDIQHLKGIGRSIIRIINEYLHG